MTQTESFRLRYVAVRFVWSVQTVGVYKGRCSRYEGRILPPTFCLLSLLDTRTLLAYGSIDRRVSVQTQSRIDLVCSQICIEFIDLVLVILLDIRWRFEGFGWVGGYVEDELDGRMLCLVVGGIPDIEKDYALAGERINQHFYYTSSGGRLGCHMHILCMEPRTCAQWILCCVRV